MAERDRAEGRSWLDFISRRYEPSFILELGPEQGAPVAPQSITVDDQLYVSIRLLHFEHPFARKAATSYTPAVYARVSWRDPLEAETPIEQLFDMRMSAGEGPSQIGQIAFQGRDLFGPAIYNGAIDLDLAMFVYKNNKAARKIVDIAAKATRAATLGSDLLTGAATGLAKSVLDEFLQDKRSLHLGLKTQLPSVSSNGVVNTGCWAILPGRHKIKSLKDVRFDPRRNRLVEGTGRPVEAPHIVYAVEVSSRNVNAKRQPEVAAAWAALQARMVKEGVCEAELEDAYAHYVRAVTTSRRLSFEDQEALVQSARRRYDFQKRILFAQGFEAVAPVSHETAISEAPVTPRLPGLESAEGDAGHVAVQANAALQDAAAAVLAVDQDRPSDGDVKDLSETLAKALEDLIDAAIKAPEDAREEVVKAAESLRRSRRWRQIAHLGEALRGAGVEYTRLTYFNAAAYVELGDLDRGEALVSRAQLSAERDNRDFDVSETLGLRGRIWKQRFVERDRAGEPDRAKAALQRAVDYYEAGAEANGDRKDYFHKINILALISAAERRGWPVVASTKAKALAKRIHGDLSRRKADDLTCWDYANLAEALIYLGRTDEAAGWLERYRAHPQIDAFKVNATRRQLVEIWGVDPGRGDMLAKVVTRMAVGAMVDDASLTLTLEEVRKLAELPLDEDETEIADLEATFGGEAAMPVRLLLRAVGMGRFVGAVRSADGRPVGTGFLLPGETLNEAWRGELVFVTNDHVVSDDPKLYMATPVGEARIVFAQVDRDTDHRIADELWRSSYRQHDVAIFRLDRPAPAALAKAAPILLAKGLPPRWRGLKQAEERGDRRRPPRVFIIGHPAGRDLEITVENNLLIDHEFEEVGAPPPPTPVKIHYRAPTEPGSSGSPVFNARTLELIGVHHMGSAQPLPGYEMPEGVRDYEANEGLWIQAVRAAIARDLDAYGGGGEGADDAGEATRRAVGAVSNALGGLMSSVANPLEAAGPAADAGETPAEDGAALGEIEPPDAQGNEAALAAAQAAPPPSQASWPALNASPDTAHLAHVSVAGGPEAPFEITGAVMRKALAFASTDPAAFGRGRALFAVRAGLPVGWEDRRDRPGFAPAFDMVETSPDHLHPLCTVGVWDLASDTFWTTAGSTLPSLAAMGGHTGAGERPSDAALAAPGAYRSRVADPEPGGEGRLMVQDACALQTTGPRMRYDFESQWTFGVEAPGARVPAEAWPALRTAAALEAGGEAPLITLTARELRIAAENIDAGDNDQRFAKLRRGSTGDDVADLQTFLGVFDEADFGLQTQSALIKRQIAEFGRADGVLTPGEAQRLGLFEAETEFA